MTGAAWYVVQSSHPAARWLNVLHWPYSAWHLSYAIIGACLAREVSWHLLGWTVLAFFLGMGLAAHCFDLLRGDPLRLALPRRLLMVVGAAALAGAAGIGLWQWAAGHVPFWLWVALPVGVLLAAGYGLEWPGLHGDWQFAAWWAGFPLLVGYFAQGVAFHPALLAALAFSLATATAQRVLSTRARYLRRKVVAVFGTFAFPDPDEPEFHVVESEPQNLTEFMLQPLDAGLKWLTLAMVTLAGGLVAWRALATTW